MCENSFEASKVSKSNIPQGLSGSKFLNFVRAPAETGAYMRFSWLELKNSTDKIQLIGEKKS